MILSGHEVPGEGEHKIMEFLRREKMQPGFPSNLRHCIYGAFPTVKVWFLGVKRWERRGEGGGES